MIQAIRVVRGMMPACAQYVALLLPSRSRYRRLLSRIKLTPSRVYRSFSPGRSSSTGSISNCFLNMTKNRLSAYPRCISDIALGRERDLTFLRFFQQNRISITFPSGAKSHNVLTKSGNVGFPKFNSGMRGKERGDLPQSRRNLPLRPCSSRRRGSRTGCPRPNSVR